TLTESAVRPSFALPLAATVYWNTTTDDYLLAEERHGIKMDGTTHTFLHSTVGTRYESGLTLTALDATFATTAGIIHDEDLIHSIGAEITCDVLYKNGAPDFEWDAAQATLYKLNGANLRYNLVNALADVPGNQYVAYWVFATNNITTPIVSLMGQRIDVNIADARANNKYETLALGTLPFEEMKLLYRVIFRNDGTPYEETQDLRNISNLPAGTFLATQHGALTGLDFPSSGHTGVLAVANGGWGTATGSFTSPGDIALLGGNVGIGVAAVASGQMLEVNGGVNLTTATARPACDAATRGTFWVIQSAADVKDEVAVCVKDALNAYAWFVLY
ncbi:MAG TPA: hypothetical protein VNA25_21370, partial [Phycisphaerae bacterium]|nr:hypothetical protein [Phycisphaerae bacterium]